MGDGFSVYGDKQLDRKLKSLKEKTAKRIAHAGVRKGVQTLAKFIKKDVPSRFKNARKGVGWKATKGRKASKYRLKNVAAQAKAGVGVGVKARRRKILKAADVKAGPRTGKGIGIGWGNFHWWVLGTKNRTTRGGKSTGSTKEQMPGFAAKAAAKSKSAVKTAMAKEVARQLVKDVKNAK